MSTAPNVAKNRFVASDPNPSLLYDDRILTLVFKGNFSHTMKTFCFSQHQLGSTCSKSKFQRRLARSSRISRYARLRPRQFLGPMEKGLKGDPGAPDLGGLLIDDSQRSGLNVEGESGKLRAEWLEAYWGQETNV